MNDLKPKKAGGVPDTERDLLRRARQLLCHAIMGLIGGRPNETQRNIIAQRGLDLPRLLRSCS